MLASTSLLPLPDLRQSRLGVTTTTVARSLPPAVLLIEAEAVLSGDAPRDPFLLCSGIVAVVSALVVLSFLGYLVWRLLRRRKLQPLEGVGSRSSALEAVFSTDIGRYYIVLLLYDLMLDASLMANFYWSSHLSVTGALCTWQAVGIVLSVEGSTLSNILISKGLLDAIAWHRNPKWEERVLCWCILLGLPVFAASLGPVLNTGFQVPFYGPVAQSRTCFIFSGARHAFALGLTGGLVTLAHIVPISMSYVAVYLKLRQAERTLVGAPLQSIGRRLLFVPLTFTVCIAPCIIMSLISTFGHLMPIAFIAVANCLAAAMGLVDVVVFLATRPGIIPSHSRRSIVYCDELRMGPSSRPTSRFTGKVDGGRDPHGPHHPPRSGIFVTVERIRHPDSGPMADGLARSTYEPPPAGERGALGTGAGSEGSASDQGSSHA